MSRSLPSEDTPILQQVDDVGEERQGQAHGKFKRNEFSNAQFALLCLLRMLDPMSFTQILPYINQFMSNLHVTDDPSHIGFYSGLVESSFALAQLAAVYPWGFISDRLGRRPVVLVGTAGLSVATILFGLSSSLSSAVFTRALGGLFSGNVPVLPTILLEMTDESNQAFTFSFFGFWWPLGSIIGPLAGGLLSEPAKKYPRHFDHRFFRSYPYFLPCLFVAGFGLICFVMAAILLQETLPRTIICESVEPPSLTHNSTNSPLSVNASEKHTVRKLLKIRTVRALCASGCALSFISTAFDILFVLFCFTPIHAGGLAFVTQKIGFALSTSGFIAAILQVLFMPTLLRRVDHAVLYHFFMKLWPLTFLLLPALNIIARRGVKSSTGELDSATTFVLWIGIAVILCIARIAFLAYSVNMLLVKRFAPNSSSLGSTAALVQFFICLARAFSPAFASMAFASNRKVLSGYMWAVIMVLLSLGGTIFSRNIVRESRAR